MPDATSPQKELSKRQRRRGPDRTASVQQLLVDINGLMKMLPFGRSKIFGLIAAGRMPAGEIVGGTRCWPVAVIDKWVADGCPVVSASAARRASKQSAERIATLREARGAQ